jgi:uncharacterized membrane protein
MSGAERAVPAVLLIGGFVAVGLMLVGLVALEVRATRSAHPVENREAGRAVDVFVSLPQIAHTLARWPPEPVAIIAAGIVVLLATPAVGLLAALVAFARAGDRRYVIICAALLVMLVSGFFLHLGG